MNLLLKYLGYAFVICVYGLFAWTGRAPVEGFIVVLMGVIAALGTSHVAANAAQAATDAAAQVTATAAPQQIQPVTLPTVVVKQ